MMIDRRLVRTVPRTRPYIAATVAVRWCSLLANIWMAFSIAALVQAEGMAIERGQTAAQGAFGAMLLREDAGGYVLVAVAAFAAAVVLVIACVRLHERVLDEILTVCSAISSLYISANVSLLPIISGCLLTSARYISASSWLVKYARYLPCRLTA